MSCESIMHYTLKFQDLVLGAPAKASKTRQQALETRVPGLPVEDDDLGEDDVEVSDFIHEAEDLRWGVMEYPELGEAFVAEVDNGYHGGGDG